MYSETDRDLFYKGVLVLHDPWVCTITTGMQKADEGLPSIIWAGRVLLVKMLVTIELHGII